MPNHCPHCSDLNREDIHPDLLCPGCQECEKMRVELLSVRESLQRERGGQGKCNSGHVSDRALWDCPVCVEAMRVERDQWKERANNSYRAGIGEVWHWQGNEYDHPESLNCPVLMTADQVREFIAMRTKLTKAERLCQAVARCEQCRGRFMCTPLHDCRCEKDRKISETCTCGGDEYQAALAEWEGQNG